MILRKLCVVKMSYYFAYRSARVGKSSLVSRFLDEDYNECYTPTIEDFHRKVYRIRGEVYQLDLLDTSGNHPFPAMRRLSFLTGMFLKASFAPVKRKHLDFIYTDHHGFYTRLAYLKNCPISDFGDTFGS